ncbi:hypothetical protein PGTUg99_018707 [Puccinia graminis f. sp. tritici]|uniref:Uncharacterized protein n=1 Tax=Puccinia graminis f. sp. tritici TaxID=56615 RepID=A0A5B0LSR5_PUCGR|nr:hypothetical protein PGTUg99_018707 [Puccinia graminis f. sp. tritici]
MMAVSSQYRGIKAILVICYLQVTRCMDSSWSGSHQVNHNVLEQTDRLEAFWSQMKVMRLQDDVAPTQHVQDAQISRECIKKYLSSLRQFRKPTTGSVVDQIKHQNSKKEVQLQIKFLLEDFHFMTKDLGMFIEEVQSQQEQENYLNLIQIAQELQSIHEFILQPQMEAILGEWANQYDLPQPKIFEEAIYPNKKYLEHDEDLSHVRFHEKSTKNSKLKTTSGGIDRDFCYVQFPKTFPKNLKLQGTSEGVDRDFCYVQFPHKSPKNSKLKSTAEEATSSNKMNASRFASLKSIKLKSKLSWKSKNRKGEYEEAKLNIYIHELMMNFKQSLFKTCVNLIAQKAEQVLVLSRVFFQTIDQLYKYELMSEIGLKSLFQINGSLEFAARTMFLDVFQSGNQFGVHYLMYWKNIFNSRYSANFATILKALDSKQQRKFYHSYVKALASNNFEQISDYQQRVHLKFWMIHCLEKADVFDKFEQLAKEKRDVIETIRYLNEKITELSSKLPQLRSVVKIEESNKIITQSKERICGLEPTGHQFAWQFERFQENQFWNQGWQAKLDLRIIAQFLDFYFESYVHTQMIKSTHFGPTLIHELTAINFRNQFLGKSENIYIYLNEHFSQSEPKISNYNLIEIEGNQLSPTEELDLISQHFSLSVDNYYSHVDSPYFPEHQFHDQEVENMIKLLESKIEELRSHYILSRKVSFGN